MDRGGGSGVGMLVIVESMGFGPGRIFYTRVAGWFVWWVSGLNLIRRGKTLVNYGSIVCG